MKYLQLLFALLLMNMSISTYAQFGPQHIISNDADNALDVFAIDLNGDSRTDVLSASSFDDKVAWYENLGGNTFSGQKIISSSATAVTHLHAGDLTGNGLPDVVAGIAGGLIWYQNLGNGNFSAGNLINNISLSSAAVFIADLDSDNQNDIVVGIGSTLLWHRNLGANSFAAAQNIGTNYAFIQEIYADDLNNDQQIDILVASFTDDMIAWHQNLGNGNFSARIVITGNLDGAIYVYAADLNGDNNKDVVAAGANDDRVSWYINNGNGGFTGGGFKTANLSFVSSVYTDDLDLDGDQDILFTSQLNNVVGWYPNNGNATFGNQMIISTQVNNPRVVYAADLDGDLDPDVISASRVDDRIAWYENLTNNCDPPTALAVSQLTSTTAKLSWSLNPSASNYVVSGGIANNPKVVYILTNTNQINLKNLIPETAYWWNVTAVCTGSTSAASSNDTFSTRELCDPPTAFNTTNIDSSSATLGWSASSNALVYAIAGRIAGAPVGSYITIQVPGTDTSIEVGGLLPCTDYQWRMISDCMYEKSPLNPTQSPIVDFQTTGCRSVEKQNGQYKDEYPKEVLHVYPNPASDHFNIHAPQGAEEIIIYNLQGRINKRVGVSDAASQPIRISTADLSSGVYFVRVITAKGNFIREVIISASN